MGPQVSLKMEGESRSIQRETQLQTKGTGVCNVDDFKETGRESWAKECGQPLKVGKGKKKKRDYFLEF